MSAIKYILVLLFIMAISCEETILDQAYTFRINQESDFKINHDYTSDDGKYSIRITDFGDSRCAVGVLCVWSGEIMLKGEFTENGNKSTFEVHSVISDLQKQPIGFTIQIIDAKPYPKIDSDSKTEDSLITLLIKKN